MTISTNNINNLSSEVTKAKKQDKKDSKDTFADIMSLTGAASGNVATGANTEKTADTSKNFNATFSNKSKSADYDVTKKNTTTKSQSDNSKTNYTKKDSTGSSSVSNKYDNTNHGSVKTTSKKSTATAADTVKDEDLEGVDKTENDVILSMLDNLVGVLTDKLGISETELKDTLSDLNMELSDLFGEDGLKSFVLEVSGATNVDLLIDENLAADLSDITDLVQNLLDETMNALSTEGLDVNEKISELAESYFDISDDEVTDVADAGYNSDAVQNTGRRNTASADETIKNSDDEVTYSVADADKNVVKESEESDGFEFEDKSFSKEQEADLSVTGNDTIETDFTQAVNQAFQNVDISDIQEMQDVDGADIVRQIVEDIEAHVTKDTTSLEVQLNPENLGKVTITVSEREGAMQARIIAENEAAKNAIEASIANLKEAFENQDLKVEAIEVMVATYSSFEHEEDNNQQEDERAAAASKGNSSINLDDTLDEDELTEQQRLEVEIMRMAGNRVNYSI